MQLPWLEYLVLHLKIRYLTVFCYARVQMSALEYARMSIMGEKSLEKTYEVRARMQHKTIKNARVS